MHVSTFPRKQNMNSNLTFTVCRKRDSEGILNLSNVTSVQFYYHYLKTNVFWLFLIIHQVRYTSELCTVFKIYIFLGQETLFLIPLITIFVLCSNIFTPCINGLLHQFPVF